jgi:drug/metabolite transporter (DMT)-like permease
MEGEPDQPTQGAAAMEQHVCPTKQRANAMMAAGLTILVWSSAFPAIRVALGAYSPEHLALLRFLIASVTLALYALRVPVGSPDRGGLPARRDLPGMALLGLLGVALYHVALNSGQRTVTAGAASLLVSTTPIFTALLAVLFLGERPPLLAWLGIGVSFAGSLLVALGEGGGLRFSPGAILILFGALCISLYVIVLKRYLPRYGARRLSCWTVWGGTLLLLPFASGLEDAVRAAPTAAALAALYLGLFPTALSYVTWAYALSGLPAATASSFSYLMPVLTLLIAGAWLGETPAPLSLGGGAIALAGVGLVHAPLRRA